MIYLVNYRQISFSYRKLLYALIDSCLNFITWCRLFWGTTVNKPIFAGQFLTIYRLRNGTIETIHGLGQPYIDDVYTIGPTLIYELPTIFFWLFMRQHLERLLIFEVLRQLNALYTEHSTHSMHSIQCPLYIECTLHSVDTVNWFRKLVKAEHRPTEKGRLCCCSIMQRDPGAEMSWTKILRDVFSRSLLDKLLIRQIILH